MFAYEFSRTHNRVQRVTKRENFRYHGNMGRSTANLNDVVNWPTTNTPLVQKSRNYLLYKSSYKLEIAAQGVAQCKVSATRVVADAALRRIG